jgi:hypothetical protein
MQSKEDVENPSDERPRASLMAPFPHEGDLWGSAVLAFLWLIFHSPEGKKLQLTFADDG